MSELIPIEADAFVLEAVASGIAACMDDRFDCEPDLVTAVAWRTEGAAKSLVASIVLDLRAFWIKGDLPGTKSKIAAHAREQLAAPIADAVASFVATGNNYVH